MYLTGLRSGKSEGIHDEHCAAQRVLTLSEVSLRSGGEPGAECRGVCRNGGGCNWGQHPQALRHGDHIRFGAVPARFEGRVAAMERDDATDMAKPDGHPEPPVLSVPQHQVLTDLREGWTNLKIAARSR